MLEIVSALEFSSVEERAKTFVLLLKCLKVLCFSNISNLYILNKFLLEIFKVFGLPINVEKCACCGSKAFERIFFNFAVGELICFNCKNYFCQELSKQAYLALRILTITEIDKLKTVKLAKGSELDLLKILVKNFEIKFDKKLNLIGILF